MQELEIQRLLREGVAAAKVALQDTMSQFQTASNQPPEFAEIEEYKARARNLLQQVVKLDKTNVQAWLWLSTVTEDLTERATCLNNVLRIDPANRQAKAGLAWIERHTGASLLPATPPPNIHSPNPADTDRLFNDQGSYSQSTVGFRYSDQALEDDFYESRAMQPQAQSDCPFCAQPISNMDTTCPHCQLPLVMDCPACNTLMDVEWNTCRECGHTMGDYRIGSVYFYHLAISYQKYHQLSKALNAIKIAERMDPDQPDLYRVMGEIQHEVGQIKESITTLELAVDKEPEQITPYLSLGRVLKQEGHWRAAEEIYREALHVAPDSSEAHFAFGDLMLQRNKLKLARSHLRHAVKLNPQHGHAWSLLGELYERYKKRASAIKAYRNARNLLSRDSLEWERAESRLRYLDPSHYQEANEGWTAKLKKWF